MGTDTILDEYADVHDGVMMDASDLLGSEGYYFMNDYYTMYLGSDWTFQVDYANDGIVGPVTPVNQMQARRTAFSSIQWGRLRLEVVMSCISIIRLLRPFS